MKREKTIKAAEEYANSIAQHEHDKNYCIEDFIAGAEWADAHPHYISVDDELPKNGALVIAITPNSKVAIAQYEDDEWNISDLYCLKNVTHWMPLPAPPKSSCSEIPTNCQSVTPSNQSKGDKK